jgi:hypothetical protein
VEFIIVMKASPLKNCFTKTNCIIFSQKLKIIPNPINGFKKLDYCKIGKVENADEYLMIQVEIRNEENLHIYENFLKKLSGTGKLYLKYYGLYFSDELNTIYLIFEKPYFTFNYYMCSNFSELSQMKKLSLFSTIFKLFCYFLKNYIFYPFLRDTTFYFFSKEGEIKFLYLDFFSDMKNDKNYLFIPSIEDSFKHNVFNSFEKAKSICCISENIAQLHLDDRFYLEKYYLYEYAEFIIDICSGPQCNSSKQLEIFELPSIIPFNLKMILLLCLKKNENDEKKLPGVYFSIMKEKIKNVMKSASNKKYEQKNEMLCKKRSRHIPTKELENHTKINYEFIDLTEENNIITEEKDPFKKVNNNNNLSNYGVRNSLIINKERVFSLNFKESQKNFMLGHFPKIKSEPENVYSKLFDNYSHNAINPSQIPVSENQKLKILGRKMNSPIKTTLVSMSNCNININLNNCIISNSKEDNFPLNILGKINENLLTSITKSKSEEEKIHAEMKKVWDCKIIPPDQSKIYT